MDILRIVIACSCFMAVYGQIDEANRLNCRICNNAITLEDCKQVAICDSTYEECYIDEVITAQLKIVYRGGCRARDVCEGKTPAAVGKRSTDEELIACSRCCDRKNDTDGCNKRLCSIPNPSRENQCYACSSSQDESGQGNVKDPLDCISFKTCNQDEVCYARTHVSGGTPTFEYGCHQKATCQLLVERTLEDRKRCESAGNSAECGNGLSLYCFTCCAWGACNYGTCLEQNDNLYDLYKRGLFDPKLLKKGNTTAGVVTTMSTG